MDDKNYNQDVIDDLIATEADEWLNDISLMVPPPRHSATKKQYNPQKAKLRKQMAKSSQKKNRKK